MFVEAWKCFRRVRSIERSQARWHDSKVYLFSTLSYFPANHALFHLQVSFMPALSNAKLAAIRSMGMGTLNKVVLHFSSVFWDQVDFLGYAGKDRRKWLLFMDMSRVTNRPILVAMAGGPFAVFVERLSDAEVVRRAMAVIKTVHPGAPDPIASQMTRWKTDRFSRGSFSFIPPGCRLGDYSIMQQYAWYK